MTSSSRAPAAEGPMDSASPVVTDVAEPETTPETPHSEVVTPLRFRPLKKGVPPDTWAPADADQVVVDDHASLDPFKSEFEPVAPAPPRRQLPGRIPVAIAGLCASVIAGWFIWHASAATPGSAATASTVAPTGTADFQSVPDGSSVAIDGAPRGVTPLRLSLPAGTHTVTLTSGSVSRNLSITVVAGGTVSQYVELAGAAPVDGGRLEIASEPAGAQVALDGTAKGRTPLVLEDVAPGQYRVTVTSGGNAVNRTVTVRRGATASLMFSGAPAAANATAGWLTFESPIDMDILEDGRVLGNTSMDRLMLPVGAHRLELANRNLEFAAERSVNITAGGTAKLAIPLPSGKLSVNAVPWADVSLDGASLGTTPLGDLSVPIGAHELVFRHPQLGERRQTVTVKAQSVSRIGIDLRK